MRAGWTIAFTGIARREVLRFARQRERFLAALVPPLVWLFIFAAGFRSVLGLSITAPYETYVLYEVYVVPGLCAMIQLFNGMQSSLSMVYDSETGAMRTLLVSPYPRWFLLGGKLVAGVLVSILQVYAFLGIAWLWGVHPPAIGWAAVLPALLLSGVMLGSLGLLISSTIRQLENFAGVMNFVIFPMFFASSALYRLWRMKESSVLLHDICALNPFTYAVELIRFALYGQVNWLALAVVVGCTVVFFGATVFMYDPAEGLWRKRPGQGGIAMKSMWMVAAALMLGSAAQAAGPVDPDWPCIQRRVPHLSLGQVWAGPLPDPAIEALADTALVQGVARALALRRTPMPEAEALIAQYAETADAAALIALFVATLEHIDTARDRCWRASPAMPTSRPTSTITSRRRARTLPR